MIVIPSYKRYTIKTIDFLLKEGYTPDDITIYVANEEEYNLYKKNYQNYKIVIGVLGIKNQREFIQSQYPEGTILISMDDDIENCNLPLKPLFDECITYLSNSTYGMVSFNPSSNLFLKKNWTFKEGRYLCVGFVHLFKVDYSICGDIDCVEDYDRCMMYIKKYGGIIRRGDAVFKSKFEASGGLSTYRTREIYLENVNKLLQKYPDDLKFNIKKNGLFKGLPNVQIRKKPIDSFKLELKKIENELNQITFPKTSITNNRRGFPVGHQKLTFGMVKGRFNGITQLSVATKKYPKLYNMLNEFGKKYIPIAFNAIHINHNVVSPKHFDTNNVGESAIVSCGTYTGCKLIIEEVEHDAYYNIIVFNGSKKEHYNTDDLVGNKYSIIFYTSK